MKLIKFIQFCLFFWFISNYATAQKNIRVVSLAASITKNMQLLGAEEMLVGCTSYCGIDPESDIQIVATAIQVNIEQLVRLQPDLVITTPLTNPETLESIRKFSIPIEIFETPRNYDEILKQFNKLGSLLGMQEQAGKIAAFYQKKTDSIARIKPLHDESGIFFQLGSRPLFTVLPETFMDDYITCLGGKNIFNDMKRGAVTRESVLKRNPDIIFIATMGKIDEEEQALWLSYEGLSAAEKRRIFVVDSDLACTPTPDGFYKTLQKMIEHLAQ